MTGKGLLNVQEQKSGPLKPHNLSSKIHVLALCTKGLDNTRQFKNLQKKAKFLKFEKIFRLNVLVLLSSVA